MTLFKNPRFAAAALVVLSLCFASGCGGKTDDRPEVEISGVVTLNGAELNEGSVHIKSTKTGESAYVNLTAGGKYSITFPNADIDSEYEVSIAPPVVEEENPLEPNKQPKIKFSVPRKYTDFTTSGLSFKIEKSGENTFNIDLKGP
tara:strand:+ start:514 stop:951 length:438 start_codon:yes stop_codon:yes gene_type:complete